MPKNTAVSAEQKPEKVWVRALYGLPLLGFFFLASKTFSPALDAIPNNPSGHAENPHRLADGLMVPLQLVYTGSKRVDAFLVLYASVFTSAIGGYDIAGRMQLIAFLSDLVAVQVIMLVESVRRGNHMTVAHLLPTLVGVMYQIFGLAFLGPVYFLLHYIQSPVGNYNAASNRSTQIGAIKPIILTVLLSNVIPGIASFTVEGTEFRQWICGLIWQPFPLYASLWQCFFGLFTKNTTAEIKVRNPTADMPYLRWAYGFAVVVGAIGNLYVRFASPVPLMEVFFDNLSDPYAPVSFMQGCAKALRYDFICSIGSGGLWVLLNFFDLKRSGKLEASWVRILSVVVGISLAIGPGAMMSIMWAWREEVLASTSAVPAQKKLS